MDTELDIANLAPLGVHTDEHIKKDPIVEVSKDEQSAEAMLYRVRSEKNYNAKRYNSHGNDNNNDVESKLQSQDEDHEQSHSPGGMEISLSPVVNARTPNNYRNSLITYV